MNHLLLQYLLDIMLNVNNTIINIYMHTNVLRCITAYGEKEFLKKITCLSYNKNNEIRACHLDIHKHVSNKKNDINTISILHTG